VTVATEQLTRSSSDEQWRRAGVWGTALNGVAVLAFMLAIGEFIVIFPMFAALFFGFAALAKWAGSTRRWPWAVVGIATLLFILSNIPYLVHDLSHPEEAFVFIPTVISLGLAIIVIVACAVIVFRRSLQPKPLLAVVGAIALVAIVASAGAALNLDSDAQQPGDLLVTEDFDITLELPAGTHSLYLENNDRYRHTFVVDELDIHLDMPGSTGRRYEVTLMPGEYRYYCDVPGHDSMEGVLRVTGG
jgi:plastocyanin